MARMKIGTKPLLAASRLVLMLAVALAGVERLTKAQAVPPVLVLDDFESPIDRVADPSQPTNIEQHWMWNQAQGGAAAGPGTFGVTTADHWAGIRSWGDTINSGRFYMVFYNDNGTNWNWLRSSLISGTWPGFNQITKMRFHIKPPVSLTLGSDGQHNYELGTYMRSQAGDPTTHSDGGSHYYHFLNLVGGVWNYVEVSWYPDHKVGQDPNTNWDFARYPTVDQGTATGSTQYGTDTTFNYFDAWTYFYFEQLAVTGGAYPQQAYLDQFELLTDTTPNDYMQSRNLTGTYVPGSNRLFVSWQRRKGMPADATNYETKYAFSNIHALGWNNATTPPGGGSIPPNGYAGMSYDNSTIRMGSNRSIFFGVRPVGQTTFAEIEIPLSQGGGVSTGPPAAPTSLRIVP
jgi:hypothetical protein